MKLYGVFLSPFTVRIMMQLDAKEIPYDLVFPPGGGLESSGFGEVNYMHRIPVLELDDGTRLYESGVISEYIEDVYPSSALLNQDPVKKAQSRLLVRLADIYILHALTPITDILASGVLESGEIDAAVARIRRGLGDLENTIDSIGYSAGSKIDLVDCSLVPALFLLETVFAFINVTGYLDDCPNVADYWQSVQASDLTFSYIKKMKEAVEHKMTTGTAI
jgi:glutathione S-transferase